MFALFQQPMQSGLPQAIWLVKRSRDGSWLVKPARDGSWLVKRARDGSWLVENRVGQLSLQRQMVSVGQRTKPEVSSSWKAKKTKILTFVQSSPTKHNFKMKISWQNMFPLSSKKSNSKKKMEKNNAFLLYQNQTVYLRNILLSCPSCFFLTCLPWRSSSTPQNC